MMGAIKKVIPVLFLAHLIGYLIVLGTLLFFPAVRIINSMSTAYLFNSAFLNYVNYIIPVQCIGIMLGYSLFFTQADLSTSSGTLQPFYKGANSVIVTLLVLTTIYIILMVWVYPLINISVKKAEVTTELFNNYMDEAVRNKESKNYEKALTNLNYARQLDKKNKTIPVIEQEILTLQVSSPSFNVKQPVEPLKTSPLELEQDDNILMKRARDAFKIADYFSAYYYASTVYRLRPDRDDARVLVIEALKKLSAEQLSERDDALRQLYIEKQNAYKALLDGEYVTAYYLFSKLKKQKPDDPDLDKYLNLSAQKLNETSFFKEEAEQALARPGTANIFFINFKKGGETELVFIKKMVKDQSNIFFEDTQVIRFNDMGEILFEFKAVYGKYYFADFPDQKEGSENSVHYINFNCLSKVDPTIFYYPAYSVKNAGEPVNMFKFFPDVNSLTFLSFEKTHYRGMSITELMLLKKYSVQFGYPEKELDLEIIHRFLLPFLFLILSIFSIAFGWSLRSRYQPRPPVTVYILIPVIAAAIFIAVKFIVFIFRIVVTYTILVMGFIPSIIFSCVTLAIALIIALVLIAVQMSE